MANEGDRRQSKAIESDQREKCGLLRLHSILDSKVTDIVTQTKGEVLEARGLIARRTQLEGIGSLGYTSMCWKCSERSENQPILAILTDLRVTLSNYSLATLSSTKRY